jgi:hypothetical protein
MRILWDFLKDSTTIPVEYTHKTDIYEMFVMLESTASIKNEVYL